MTEKLQAVVDQLAPLVIRVENKPEDVSYKFEIFTYRIPSVAFAVHLWTKSNVVKSHNVEFYNHDSCIAIVKKIKEVKDILSGKINPFEQAEEEKK